MTVSVGVVGSANVDLVVRVAALPRRGETVLGGDVERSSGGKGANQAVAAAAAGAKVTLFARLGDDESGRWLASQLAARGVTLGVTRASALPTGVALITVEEGGENTIVVAPGANAELDLGDSDLRAFDVVVAQLEVGDRALRQAAAARRLVLNVAPSRPVPPEVLAAAAVVVANETEAEALDLAALASAVVTRGAAGAVHYRHGREVARAIPPAVDVVDTVGAGDVFCATYAVRLAAGDDDAAALRYAVTAGALATRARGAQGAVPTTEEVNRWLARAS